MPTATVEIPEIEASITRPVNHMVCTQMMQRIGIPPNTTVVLNGYLGSLPIQNSTMDKLEAPRQTSAINRIQIDVTEEYDPNTNFTTAVQRPEQFVFFKDSKLRVYVKPQYQTVRCTMRVVFTAEDRTTAESWRRSARRRATQGIIDQVHDISYSYMMPDPIMYILYRIHLLREANQGYGENLGQWLDECFSSKMTVLTNANATSTTFAIRENQLRVMGWYNFDMDPPKSEDQNKSGAHTTEFEYTFVYDRCENVVIQYPIMIHNQIVPEQIRDTRSSYDIDRFLEAPSFSHMQFQKFLYGEGGNFALRAKPGIPIPFFDDWLPKITRPALQDIFRIQMQVDPANPTDLISLTNLGHYKLKPNAIKILLRRPQAVTRLYDSVFHVELHRWYDLTDPSDMVVSPELDIRSVDPLSEREMYHLVIGLVTDPSLLSEDALDDLAEIPDFFEDYIKLIDPNTKIPPRNPPNPNNPNNPTDPTDSDGSISKELIKEVIREVSKDNPIRTTPELMKWHRISAFTIIAHKGE